MRRTFAALSLILLGAALGWPRTAASKGQICNAPVEEGRRIDLTLRATAIDGVSTFPPREPDAGRGEPEPPRTYHLRTEKVGGALRTHARLFDGDAGPRVLHLEDVTRDE